MHSNGFSLIRKILEKERINKQLKKELLMPTKIYSKEILYLANKKLINAAAHITGGGLIENLLRSIPKNLSINIDLSKIKVKKIFKWIKSKNISDKEMLNTFNCGVGFCIIVPKKNIKRIKKYFSLQYKPYEIGYVSKDIKKDYIKEFYYMVKKNACIFISGKGSNLKNLIIRSREYNFPISIKLIVSNQKNAYGLKYAKKNSIPYLIVNTKFRDYELKTLKHLKKHNIQIICLAGYMKIISKNFIKNFKKKIINIHPSLLPKFKGLNTYSRILSKKRNSNRLHCSFCK